MKIYRNKHTKNVNDYGILLEMAETIKKYGFVDVGYKLFYQTRFFGAPKYMSLLNTNSDHRARPEDTRNK